MASIATYPDPGYNCVKWATSVDQADLYKSQKYQGIAISVFGGVYILLAMASIFSPRHRSRPFAVTLPLIIAGAVAMGTGIPMATRTDANAVYDSETQNLLVAGWASVIVPIIVATFAGAPKLQNTVRFRTPYPVLLE